MRSRLSTPGARRAALVCLLPLGFGCSSPVWLAVDTQPAGSRVTVQSEQGVELRDKPAPAQVELRSGGNASVYVIKVEPPDTEADRWEAASVKMSLAELRALPGRKADGQDVRQLKVNLEKKPLSLLVTAKPATAQVTVRNTLGQPLSSGPAPLSLSFFPVQESEQLTVEVKPDATTMDRFETRTMKMTVAEIRRLPAMSGDMGRRRLDVDLAEMNVSLVVETRPAQSRVTVKDSSGATLGEGSSPLALSLAPRSGAEVLTFVAEPTGPAAAQHQPASKDLTFEYLRTLPRLNEQTPRRITVELREAPFVFVRELITYPGDDGTLVGSIRSVRAYREIAESGPTAPTRIIDLGPDLAIEGLSLSPDDQRIAFALTELAEVTSSADLTLARSTLQAVRTEAGGRIQHITTDNFRDRTPAFTRDGKWLLFASDRRRRDGLDILRVSAEAARGGVADIYVDQRGAAVSRPSHASDGTVAFLLDNRDRARPANRFQIWTVGGPNQFPSQIALGTDPAISPDGQRIAFVAPDGNLWVIGSDGAGATQLTFEAEGIRDAYLKALSATEREQIEALNRRGVVAVKPYASPSWSADSQLILFTAMEGRDPTGRPNEDLWVIRPDGTAKQQLTSNGSADRWPLITADHRQVFFLSNRGGYWAIWRMTMPQVSG